MTTGKQRVAQGVPHVSPRIRAAPWRRAVRMKSVSSTSIIPERRQTQDRGRRRSPARRRVGSGSWRLLRAAGGEPGRAPRRRRRSASGPSRSWAWPGRSPRGCAPARSIACPAGRPREHADGDRRRASANPNAGRPSLNGGHRLYGAARRPWSAERRGRRSRNPPARRVRGSGRTARSTGRSGPGSPAAARRASMSGAGRVNGSGRDCPRCASTKTSDRDDEKTRKTAWTSRIAK